MNETNNEPIGEPQPIDPRQGQNFLKRIAVAITIAGGGVIAFTTLLAPTRLSGASRSARLKWQQREKEIQETIKNSDATRPESSHPSTAE